MSVFCLEGVCVGYIPIWVSSLFIYGCRLYVCCEMCVISWCGVNMRWVVHDAYVPLVQWLVMECVSVHERRGPHGVRFAMCSLQCSQ